MKLKIKYLVHLIILSWIWLIYFLMVDSNFYIFEGESSHYLLMAKSLARDHRYWDFYLVKPQPHIKIPPLFSIFLAPLYYYFGFNILVVKLFVFFWIIIATVIGYLLFFNVSGDEKKSLFIILVSFLFPFNYSLMHKISSEFPYLALSYLALFYLSQVERKEVSWSKAIFLGFLIGLCFLMRSVGLALVFALAVFMVIDFFKTRSLKRLFLRFIILAISSLISLSWILRVILLRPEGQFSYFHMLFAKVQPGSLELGMMDLPPPLWSGPEMITIEELAQRIINNIIFYFQALLFQPMEDKFSYLFIILFILALLGMVKSLRKNITLGLYGILNLFSVLVWPFQEVRFLAPISGIMIFWTIEGTNYFKERLGKRWIAYIITYFSYGLLLLALAGFCYKDYRIWKQGRRHIYPRNYQVSRYFRIIPLSPPRDRFCQLLFYIKEHTEPDATVACISPHLMNLIAERRGTLFPATISSEEFWNYLKENNVNYIMRDEIYKEIGGINLMTPEYLIPALKSSPYSLKRIYQVPFSETMLLSVNYMEK